MHIFVFATLSSRNQFFILLDYNCTFEGEKCGLDLNGFEVTSSLSSPGPPTDATYRKFTITTKIDHQYTLIPAKDADFIAVFLTALNLGILKNNN